MPLLSHNAENGPESTVVGLSWGVAAGQMSRSDAPILLLPLPLNDLEEQLSSLTAYLQPHEERRCDGSTLPKDNGYILRTWQASTA